MPLITEIDGIEGPIKELVEVINFADELGCYDNIKESFQSIFLDPEFVKQSKEFQNDLFDHLPKVINETSDLKKNKEIADFYYELSEKGQENNRNTFLRKALDYYQEISNQNEPQIEERIRTIQQKLQPQDQKKKRQIEAFPKKGLDERISSAIKTSLEGRGNNSATKKILLIKKSAEENNSILKDIKDRLLEVLENSPESNNEIKISVDCVTVRGVSLEKILKHFTQNDDQKTNSPKKVETMTHSSSYGELYKAGVIDLSGEDETEKVSQQTKKPKLSSDIQTKKLPNSNDDAMNCDLTPKSLTDLSKIMDELKGKRAELEKEKNEKQEIIGSILSTQDRVKKMQNELDSVRHSNGEKNL